MNWNPVDTPPLPGDDDMDVDMLARLAAQGGVKFVDFLLAMKVQEFETPETFRDLLALPEDVRSKWIAACVEELEALEKRGVYELVDLPEGRRAIRNRWVFNVKSDGRLRARLVAKGFSQVEGIDYNELFSPVIRYESARVFISLAAQYDWDFRSVDVKTAYLYGKLDEEIYMEQPEGFRLPGQENKVWRLRRAIYGLKQAGREWWKELHASMIEIGFKQCRSDSGVYYYRHPKTGELIIAVVYVDDVGFMGRRGSSLLKELEGKFTKKWECRVHGECTEFLGMKISRNRKEGRIFIDQIAYLDKILSRFQISPGAQAFTPLAAGFKFVPNTATSTPSFRRRYQQLVGSLMYLMIGTRPDIGYAVVKLAQQAANPAPEHYRAGIHVMKYLNTTRNYALRYQATSRVILECISDSDYAEDPSDRKSVGGNVCLIADGAVTWSSQRQKTVSLSSTEAEYKEVSDAARQVVWLHTLLSEVGLKFPTPVLYADNDGSIFWASNPVVEKRSKHVDIRYHYVRELVEMKKIELGRVATEDNPADIFTKNLGRTKFERFRPLLGLVFDFDEEAWKVNSAPIEFRSPLILK